MSNCYIIAAGGTGAICARSFIYLAAAGCADSTNTYHILLMDKDKESDAMTACENLLSDYNDMYRQLGSETFTLPEIKLYRWNFTQQILDEYTERTGLPAASLANLTLNRLLNPTLDAKIDQLLRTLYTDAELNVDMKNGFYGHPNIGSPVFSYILDRFLSPQHNAFMGDLISDLKTSRAYVYLFGSLFGGTGATVLPNVVLALRGLKDPIHATLIGEQNLVLGGAVMMPYFRLPSLDPGSVYAAMDVRPEDTKFQDQTREALKYYHDSGLLGEMMNLTLLGCSQPDVTSEVFAPGGEQTQHFHITLMLAAVCANRFFSKTLGNMYTALSTVGQPVTPQGELLLWKFTPNDPNAQGTYQTLTAGELGLTDELSKMKAFLRFSTVVSVFMRELFNQPPSVLKDSVEVQSTVLQMNYNGQNMNPKNLTDSQILTCYTEPVNKACAICRGFIRFFFDVALTGYDWTKYCTWELDTTAMPVEINERQYYPMVRRDVNTGHASAFGTRWTDLGAIDEIERVLTADPKTILVTVTLNQLCSFALLDSDSRQAVRESGYPNSIGQIYQEKMRRNIEMGKKLFGGLQRNNIQFHEIYAELRKLCNQGG